MFQFTLVGASFRPTEAKDVLKEASIGDAVTFVAEPTNQYDPNAVQVHLDDVFVGFVPRTDNSALSAFLLEGNTVRGEIIAFESTLKPVIEYDMDESDTPDYDAESAEDDD